MNNRTTDSGPTEDFAHQPSTIRLGDLEVRRLGYGAMRLPGKDVWGDPDDPARARKVLRRAVELGVNFIDTAWYYGPLVSNRLIAEVLHPYPRDHDHGIATRRPKSIGRSGSMPDTKRDGNE